MICVLVLPSPIKAGYNVVVNDIPLMNDAWPSDAWLHLLVLAGYGAEAIQPYLAMETLQDRAPDAAGAEKAIRYYVKAIGKGRVQARFSRSLSRST